MQLTVAERLTNVRDVADDLSRELLRVPVLPDNIVYAMVAFIKTEAEAALATGPRRVPNRTTDRNDRY